MELDAPPPMDVRPALLQHEQHEHEQKPTVQLSSSSTPGPEATSAGTTPVEEKRVVAVEAVEARAAVEIGSEDDSSEDNSSEEEDVEIVIVPARRAAAIVLAENEEDEEEEQNEQGHASLPQQQPALLSIVGLPLPGARFATKDDFVAACRAASVASTGFNMHKCFNEEAFILLTCARRLTHRCRARCAARRSEVGDWIVQRGSYVGEHVHAEKMLRHRSSKATNLGRHQERTVEESQSSDDDDESTLPAGTQGPRRDLAAYRIAFPGTIPAIPNLPQPGDSFPTVDAILFATRSVMTPITGTSLRKVRASTKRYTFSCHHTAWNNPWRPVSACAFNIVGVEKDGRWLVDRSSCYQHSHGRAEEVIADPSWRPLISGSRRYNEQEDIDQLRIIASTSNSSSIDEPSPPPKRKRSSLGPGTPTSTGSRASTSHLNNIKDASRDHIRSSSHHLPPTSASRSAAPPPPPPSSSLFLPTLTNFLTSLNPSLSTSALLLYDAGVKDPSLLVAFLALEDSAREGFLVDAKLALLQRHLLKVKVKQARERGWEVVV